MKLPLLPSLGNFQMALRVFLALVLALASLSGKHFLDTFNGSFISLLFDT